SGRRRPAPISWRSARQPLERFHYVDATFPGRNRVAQALRIALVGRLLENPTDGAPDPRRARGGREAHPRPSMADPSSGVVLVAAHGDANQRYAGHQPAHGGPVAAMRDEHGRLAEYLCV